MTIAERLLPELEEEAEKTRKILERVPEDKPDWKPHDKSMSLSRLAGHMAELPKWAANILAAPSLDLAPGSYEPYFFRNRDEALKFFNDNVKSAVEALRPLQDTDMDAIWTLDPLAKLRKQNKR